MDKLRLVPKLMSNGFDLIDAELFGEAIKIGQQLKKLRHSSAFEIMALGHLRQGEISKALAILEEGVSKADRVWVLWKLLGDARSEAGRFSEAENAYQSALARAACDDELVHLSRAIAFSRAGKFTKAASAIRHVRTPRLRRRAEACRIRIALKLGRNRAAEQLARRLSRRPPIAGESPDRENQAEILLASALGLRSNPKTRGRSRRLAFRAVEQNATSVEALEIIREGNPSKGRSRLYQLLISGVWCVPLGKSRTAPGFVRSCQVAAPSDKAAFRHAKPFFPASVRKSLVLDESKIIPTRHRLLEGAYFLSGYCFYRRRTRA